MNKKNFAVFLMGISIFLIILFFKIELIGYSIFENNIVNIYFLELIGVIIFICSFFILTSRITLDAIIIPTSASEKRTRQKVKEVMNQKKYMSKLIIASGGKTPALNKKYLHGAQIIYEKLREAGIKPANIKIEGKSRDNLENIIYSLKKLEGQNVKKIGIVSYPTHLDRFEKIIEKGKEEGIISRDINFYRIETDEKFIEKLYEIPTKVFTKYRLNKGFGNIEKTDSIMVGGLKKLVDYIMKFLS